MLTALFLKLLNSILNDLLMLRKLTAKLMDLVILILYSTILLPLGGLAVLLEKFTLLRKLFYFIILMLLILFTFKIQHIYETRNAQHMSSEQSAKLHQYSTKLQLLKDLHEADPNEFPQKTAYLYDALERIKLNFPSISENEFNTIFNN